MLSSLGNSGMSCCRQTPPAVTIRPSCPAHSCKRLGGTDPSFGSEARFDRLAAGGRRSRGGE